MCVCPGGFYAEIFLGPMLAFTRLFTYLPNVGLSNKERGNETISGRKKSQFHRKKKSEERYLPKIQRQLIPNLRPRRPRRDIIQPRILGIGTPRLEQDLHVGDDGPLGQDDVDPIVGVQDVGCVGALGALGSRQADHQARYYFS